MNLHYVLNNPWRTIHVNVPINLYLSIKDICSCNQWDDLCRRVDLRDSAKVKHIVLFFTFSFYFAFCFPNWGGKCFLPKNHRTRIFVRPSFQLECWQFAKTRWVSWKRRKWLLVETSAHSREPVAVQEISRTLKSKTLLSRLYKTLCLKPLSNGKKESILMN